jgi:hypothetical protein
MAARGCDSGWTVAFHDCPCTCGLVHTGSCWVLFFAEAFLIKHSLKAQASAWITENGMQSRRACCCR